MTYMNIWMYDGIFKRKEKRKKKKKYDEKWAKH